MSTSSPFGFVAFSHANDDWRECRDYILERLGLQPSARPRPAPSVSTPRVTKIMQPAYGANHCRFADEIWRAAVHPRGTIVERYLASRALVLSDDVAGEVVRFHPNTPWRDEKGFTRVPAMISLFRMIDGDEPIAIQRTRLSPDGAKLGRMSLGPTVGAAIKIDPDEHVEQGLHLGEGLETCLSARQLHLQPIWALGSAGAIAKFPVLAGIESLTLLSETDKTGANARAIEECGQRWVDANNEVIVVSPNIGGDINDALQGKRYEED